LLGIRMEAGYPLSAMGVREDQKRGPIYLVRVFMVKLSVGIPNEISPVKKNIIMFISFFQVRI